MKVLIYIILIISFANVLGDFYKNREISVKLNDEGTNILIRKNINDKIQYNCGSCSEIVSKDSHCDSCWVKFHSIRYE